MNNIATMGKHTKILGWIILIAGFFALMSPFFAGASVAVVVGMMMLISGVVRVVDSFQGGGVWTGLFGVLYSITGFMIVAEPLSGLLALTMLLIIYFMFVGVGEVISAFQMRPVKGWGLMLFSGIISILLAMMIWSQWPLSGVWAVGTLVGIQLIFSGITMISVGSMAKKFA